MLDRSSVSHDGDQGRAPSAAYDPLSGRFAATRAHTLELADGLSDADATVQSMPDASPAKWHLAHTTWFFETFVLRDHSPGYAPFDPAYHYLFNSYYEGEGERQPRPQRGMITRPSLDDIREYRRHVDRGVLAVLPSLPPAARDLVELGCQHEAQHQELLVTDIVHLFSQNPLAPAFRTPRPSPYPAVAPIDWVGRESGIAEVGAGQDGFAFDCELPRHQVLLAPHVIADRLITNGEWQTFIDDGGYSASALWLSDGWAWLASHQIAAPLYWRGECEFGLGGLAERDDNAPVCHVSYYEADAYARWAGARLPTEFEWEAAVSVGQLKQLYGEGWQWTGSAFLPYPGFRAAPGAVGEYNGKFMSGQMVLRGSSAATPDWTWRATTRNFFPPETRWQFTSVRLAKDL